MRAAAGTGSISLIPAADGAANSDAERLMRSVIDSLEGRMCLLAADGTVLGGNRDWDHETALLGLPESGVGSSFFDLCAMVEAADTDRERLVTTVTKALARRELHTTVKLSWHWAGRFEHVVVRAHSIADHDVARAVVTIIDISEAMSTQIELELLARRAHLLALVAEHTDNAVTILDASGHIEWVNDAFCALNGYDRAELTGRHRLDLWQGDHAHCPELSALREAMDDGRPVDVELPAQTRSGETYWLQMQMQPVLVGNGLDRFVCVSRDISARKQAEEQLRVTNQHVRTLAEEIATEKTLLDRVLSAIPHLVYWKGSDLRYGGANPAFLAMRGLQDLAQVRDRCERDLPVDDDLSQLLPDIEKQVLATGVAQLDLHTRLRSEQAGAVRRELLVSVLPQRDPASGRTVGVIGVAADVTDAAQLERQLAQSRRLESIGQLAAGISHEINTPVQYVSDNTRFVSETVGQVLAAVAAARSLLDDAPTAAGSDGTGEPDPSALAGVVDRTREVLTTPDLAFLESEISSALSQSLEGLNRVSEIVRAMKDFSHPGAGRGEADLSRIVQSTLQVCRNEWKYVAEVQLDLDPALRTVPCYEGELKQALLNIVVNAAHSIEEARNGGATTGMGTITVRTRKQGDWARIMVQDTGTGMTEKTRQRIFDPFFTTKEVGRGTGQGLSVTYAIVVRKHGGSIEVESAPGAGSTFVISLPLT